MNSEESSDKRDTLTVIEAPPFFEGGIKFAREIITNERKKDKGYIPDNIRGSLERISWLHRGVKKIMRDWCHFIIYFFVYLYKNSAKYSLL